MTGFSLHTKPIGAVLAGGDGRRLGLGPKPLVMLAGKPLLRHVMTRLKPQTSALVLGLRSAEPWAQSFEVPVIPDEIANAGPAASVAAVLQWAKDKSPTVLMCPADCPFIPLDLAQRLSAALDDKTDIVVATSGGQRHHLISLWRTRLADQVSDMVRAGVVAVHRIQQNFRTTDVTWPTAPVDPFFNINTPDDLTMAEAIWSSSDQQPGATL